MDSIGRIGAMDALLFTIVLEVMLLQMKILESSAQRCILQHIRKASQSGKQQGDKLSRDLNLLKDIIRRTLIEIAETGEWCTLQQAVVILQQSASSLISLRVNYNELKRTLASVHSKLATNRHHCAFSIRNCSEKIAFLRDKIKNCMLNTNTQLLYAEKWIGARAESLEMLFQSKPTQIQRFEHEPRIHNEIVQSYELQIKEREDILAYWQVRYTNDLASLKQRVIEQCELLQSVTIRREELQKLYNLHDGEIRAWLTFKRERAARLAREERLRKAAMRVQSWWRGVMVRRALGAFKFLAKKSPAKSKKK